MPSVNFVCYGNTCRSPIAEACLKHVINTKSSKEQWTIESTGTHVERVGQSPNPRGVEVMKTNGIYKYLEGKTAKMFTKEEWNNFDVIVAMDDNNYKFLSEMVKDAANCCPSKLKMFGDYENLPDFPKAIADPYGSEDPLAYQESEDPLAYQEVLERCTRLSENIYNELSK